VEEEKEPKKKDQSQIPYPDNKFISMGVSGAAPSFNMGLGGKKPSVENLQIIHQLSDNWSSNSTQSFR